MTKVALIGDIHVGVRNDSPVFQEYLTKCFDWTLDILSQYDIKHVIQLGDLVDRRKYLSYTTAHMMRNRFLQPLEARRIETHIIAGNHDQTYRNTHMVNALDEMVTGRYKDIHTYTTPKLITIDDFDFQLLPWITESNKAESYDAIKKSRASVLIGHLELAGFEMFRGIVTEHGDDRKLFERFDLVLSGHYHHKSSAGNIHYLGAFAEFIWSDFNDPRGIHVFDTHTHQLEFHQNPFSIFKLLPYDDRNDKNILNKIKNIDYGQYKDTYVKVVCAGRDNHFVFDLMLDNLYKAGPIDISIVEDVTSIIDHGTDDNVDETADTSTILSTYVKSLTLPVPNDKMINYLQEVYEEAVTTEHV